MEAILLIALLLSFKGINAQETMTVNKTGWLVYYGDKTIWFESPINKNAGSNNFFKLRAYGNGLVVNHISIAKYYKSIAKGYSIKAFYLDITKKTEAS